MLFGTQKLFPSCQSPYMRQVCTTLFKGIKRQRRSWEGHFKEKRYQKVEISERSNMGPFAEEEEQSRVYLSSVDPFSVRCEHECLEKPF